MSDIATSRVKVRYKGKSNSLHRGAFYTVNIEEIRERRFFRADRYQIFVRRIGGNNAITFYYDDIHELIKDFQILDVISIVGKSGIKWSPENPVIELR